MAAIELGVRRAIGPRRATVYTSVITNGDETGPELEVWIEDHAQVRERELAIRQLDDVWPSDARALVASRLRHFLQVSSDVAYDAKLIDRNGTKVFADPTLEARPKEWKLCFRAGKPATDAARAFAQKWLSDLAAAGVK